MKIWTLGDAVVDLLPGADQQYRACPGGAPLNVAVGAARLGCDSGFIGRLGDDPFGALLQRTLADEGVDIRAVQRDRRYRTSTVLVSLEHDGERGFTFLVNPSADRFLTPETLPDFGVDLLHFCSLALPGEACRDTLDVAIGRLKPRGGLLSFDVNLREQMWDDKQQMHARVHQYAARADILKLSQEEAFWLTGSRQRSAAIAALKGYSARLKVVTCGADGATVLWQDQVIHFNGYRVDSVDTTGAGDAFMAGLLAGIARHHLPQDLTQLRQLIARACACGALATTRKGALTAVPDAGAVNAFIASSPLPDYQLS